MSVVPFPAPKPEKQPVPGPITISDPIGDLLVTMGKALPAAIIAEFGDMTVGEALDKFLKMPVPDAVKAIFGVVDGAAGA